MGPRVRVKVIALPLGTGNRQAAVGMAGPKTTLILNAGMVKSWCTGRRHRSDTSV